MRSANQRPPLMVQIGAVGLRARWLAVADFAAASRACHDFIEANDLGASAWRGGRIVEDATKKGIVTVSYNGRVWLDDGTEAQLGKTSLTGPVQTKRALRGSAPCHMRKGRSIPGRGLHPIMRFYLSLALDSNVR